MRHQPGRLLSGPGQDHAAGAVRDDDHRVHGAELFDLGDEQFAGLAKVDAGRRGGLGGQQGSVEGPAGEGGRAAGARPGCIAWRTLRGTSSLGKKPALTTLSSEISPAEGHARATASNQGKPENEAGTRA